MHVQHLSSPAFAQMGLPFSEMVRVGDMLHLSGQMGTLPGQVKLVQGGVAAEARQALANIRDALEHQGYSLRHVVKCTVMLADVEDWPAFNAIYREFFPPPFPARSAFGATGLALGGRVEIEVLASCRL
jgi:reactive intermediate/imine deaminase